MAQHLSYSCSTPSQDPSPNPQSSPARRADRPSASTVRRAASRDVWRPACRMRGARSPPPHSTGRDRRGRSTLMPSMERSLTTPAAVDTTGTLAAPIASTSDESEYVRASREQRARPTRRDAARPPQAEAHRGSWMRASSAALSDERCHGAFLHRSRVNRTLRSPTKLHSVDRHVCAFARARQITDEDEAQRLSIPESHRSASPARARVFRPITTGRSGCKPPEVRAAPDP